MAFAHVAAAAARFEQVGEALMGAATPMFDAFQHAQLGGLAQQGPQLGEVLSHRRFDARRAAPRRIAIAAGNAGVEGGDALRQCVDVPVIQGALPRQPVEQRFLGKAPHLDGVFDDGARGRAQPRCVAAPPDRRDFKVDPRRQAAIEAQFLLAVEAPLFQGAEIQKAEIERLLQLVGELAGEQDMGNVGFQLLDGLDRMRIARRGAQRLDKACLCDGFRRVI